jgi:hypothetical protein
LDNPTFGGNPKDINRRFHIFHVHCAGFGGAMDKEQRPELCLSHETLDVFGAGRGHVDFHCSYPRVFYTIGCSRVWRT